MGLALGEGEKWDRRRAMRGSGRRVWVRTGMKVGWEFGGVVRV